MQDFIRENSEPLTVADLASECGFCPSWFNKQFRNDYGCSPMEFLNRYRVKVAYQLLRSGKSITEAAELSGFGAPSNLYRHFMKEYGFPPRRYAKKE